MSNQKHTPGPWEFVASGEYGYSVLWNPETRDEILATGGINDGDSPITWMGEELTDANRRLIEAAPDMFAALDRLARLGNGFEYGNSEGNIIAQAAILKALTGGAE